MSVGGIEAIGGFVPFQPLTLDGVPVSGAATGQASGVSFGDMISGGLDRLQKVQNGADVLATQAATGDLQAIHKYTIAATEAQLTTQLTTAVRNKALEAFQEIMRMQVG